MRERECCLWLIKALTPVALSFSLPPPGLLIWMGIAFGKVIKGMGVVRSVENVNTKGGDLPIQEVIVDCGQLLEGADDGVCNFFKDGEVYLDWPVDLDTKLENISWWVTTVDAIGNEQFKKQDYKMALRKYRKVLWYVDICCQLEEIDEGKPVASHYRVSLAFFDHNRDDLLFAEDKSPRYLLIAQPAG